MRATDIRRVHHAPTLLPVSLEGDFVPGSIVVPSIRNESERA
jgi:hypothetical protein